MISSLTNPTVKQLVRLHQKKYRDQSKMFLVEGEHLLEEAYQSGSLVQIFAKESFQTTYDGFDIERISDSVATKISQTQSTSNVFGLCKQRTSTLEGTHYLLCDGIQDPGNLGTMIRTAHSFGYDGVIISHDSADFYNDKTIRSTQGALFHINLLRKDLTDIIHFLKSQNIKVVGTALENSVEMSSVQADKVALIVGNEGQGIRQELLKLCDVSVKIETVAFESLNVSVASGIAMYHFKKGENNGN